jgi:hypothetical protein
MKRVVSDLIDTLAVVVTERVEANPSFAAREAMALAVADEVVRRYLELELRRRAHREPREVIVEGHRYRRHQPGRVVYHSLSGPLEVTRWTYRRTDIRNGPTVVPLEHEAGLIHGATPAFAFSVTQAYGQGPLRAYEDTMRAAHRHLPSRSTLERLGKTIGMWLKDDVMDLEPLVRGAEPIPQDAHAIAMGLDRTSTPIAEPIPTTEPPPKHPHPRARRRPEPVVVHYRMAYVGTVAVFNRDGVSVAARRYAATAQDGPDNILERMTLDVQALRSQRPEVPLLVIQDGAPEMWNLVREKLQAANLGNWEGLIDLYHAKEHLAHVVELLERDPHRRRERYDKYSALLDKFDGGMKRVVESLRNEILDKQIRNPKVLAHYGYLSTSAWAGLMRYAKFRRQHFPVGSGVTEGACKSLVTTRAKRSGQRWQNDGLSAVLTIRGLHQSSRLEPVWSLFTRKYNLPVSRVPS